MARRVKVASDPALVAELREIEADWKARCEAGNAEFRTLWAAKIAGAPAPKPIHVSKLRPTRL